MSEDSRARVEELLERLREIDPDTLTRLVYETGSDTPDGGFKNQFQKDPWVDRARPSNPGGEIFIRWRF